MSCSSVYELIIAPIPTGCWKIAILEKDFTSSFFAVAAFLSLIGSSVLFRLDDQIDFVIVFVAAIGEIRCDSGLDMAF
ncbi:MAG: hypothetical protein GX946_10140 [Oligosphaeraceae bacterium]|nr:hypothetical protein [Oligosphaeraceae bacterium]